MSNSISSAICSDRCLELIESSGEASCEQREKPGIFSSVLCSSHVDSIGETQSTSSIVLGIQTKLETS